MTIYPDDDSSIIEANRLAINGSIDVFANHNMYHFNMWNRKSITGNISVACANWYKLYQIYFNYSAAYSNNASSGQSSNLISGNINVFSDKYDVYYLQFMSYPNVTGELKSLKNLKKLTSVYLRYSGCTGVRTDLYNQGANITAFQI